MEIAKEVSRIMLDSLNGQEEGALVVSGLVRKFGFSPEKISEHKETIRALLNEMPKEFHKETGGGMSFLNLCMDKNGDQWGEHRNMEELIALGIAAGMASYTLPREMWDVLPGAVPYVTFDTAAETALTGL